MPPTKTQVAQSLLEIRAVSFNPQTPIRFQSGILSPVYVDNRRLIAHPTQWQIVIEGFRALITQETLPFTVIAGIAVGGVPHSSVLAYTLHVPSVFIRKEAKGHGAKKQIEGGEVAHQHALLIEDLVTTGESSLRGVEILRKDGATVTDVLTIVSYGFPDTLKTFAKNNVRLHTLTDFPTVVQVALNRGILGSSESAVINDWVSDPYHWAERHGLA